LLAWITAGMSACLIVSILVEIIKRHTVARGLRCTVEPHTNSSCPWKVQLQHNLIQSKKMHCVDGSMSSPSTLQFKSNRSVYVRRTSMVAFTISSSSYIAVRNRWISTFNHWISSQARWILKYFTIASRWAGLVQSKEWMSECDWRKRLNSPRKLYSTISFQVSCGHRGTRAAAWVLYWLSALQIASEQCCKALLICWHNL
jgi:hypothetical protein